MKKPICLAYMFTVSVLIVPTCTEHSGELQHTAVTASRNSSTAMTHMEKRMVYTAKPNKARIKFNWKRNATGLETTGRPGTIIGLRTGTDILCGRYYKKFIFIFRNAMLVVNVLIRV